MGKYFNKLRGYVKQNRTAITKCAALVSGLGALFATSVVFAAAPSAITISTIASNVDSSVKQMATILTDVSLIAGIGFVMASFFKFHQHKLNPTQVPMSQGITLLLIGAGLTLFPTMLPTAKSALFGSATIAQVGGSQIGDIVGK